MRWRTAPLRAAGLLIGLGINAGLLASVVMLATSDGRVAVDRIPWSVNLSGEVANAANRKPIDGYAQILARPVFFKSREPFVPAPPPPPPPLVPVAPPVVIADPGLALGGVMIKHGLSKAYLFSKAGAVGAWAGEGETFQGWKVTSVDRSGVKLEQSGRSIDLQLYPRD
jgi:hypothetical protein